MSKNRALIDISGQSGSQNVQELRFNRHFQEKQIGKMPH